MERSKCIIILKAHVFEHHMYIGNEEELYMYIQSHACIVGTYTAPVPMQVHWTTLVQSQSTVVLHWLQKTWQNTEFTAIHYNYTGPLTHNMNMYLLCALFIQ